MPSSEQTANLGLNRWRGSDIPTREDFVADNEILDSAIAALQQGGGGEGGGPDPRLDTHLADRQMHLTLEERQALDTGPGVPVMGTFTGDGQAFQTIVLGFRPRFGFVFASGQPVSSIGSNGNFTTTMSGFLSLSGQTRGLEATATGFRAMQHETGTVTGTTYHAFNRAGVTYVYVVWPH
ncbi:MAG: hypothetical protein FWE19_08205 [Oscillospiraceae bacterium]|nr:hypothetical protein [Oscillospiraceae bacterium]